MSRACFGSVAVLGFLAPGLCAAPVDVELVCDDLSGRGGIADSAREDDSDGSGWGPISDGPGLSLRDGAPDAGLCAGARRDSGSRAPSSARARRAGLSFGLPGGQVGRPRINGNSR